MPVYKRAGQSEYSYDFRYRRQRFSGPTGCTSRREAEKVEETERARVRDLHIDASKPLTFEGAATQYWNEVGQHHDNQADTLRTLDWLQDQIGKKTMLSEITGATIARAVAKRRADAVSNATVNRTVTQPMRAILRRARQTWEQQVREIRWKDHFLPEAEERVREATKDEEASLSSAVRSDYAPALRFALLTGCRRMEIVGLEWAHVDFFTRQFTVLGKREKTRVVPMTKAVYALLWSLKDHHPVAVFTHVVHRPREGQQKGERVPITKEGFKTEWRRTKGRADVKNFRFHDTRHTAATRLVRATGSIKQAQKLLGHTEIATTARYAHVTMDDLRAGLEAVDAIQAAPETNRKAADNAE